MSECTHHWTVTSECPYCLRAELAAARADLEAFANSESTSAQQLRSDLAAARARVAELTEERDNWCALAAASNEDFRLTAQRAERAEAELAAARADAARLRHDLNDMRAGHEVLARQLSISRELLVECAQAILPPWQNPDDPLWSLKSRIVSTFAGQQSIDAALAGEKRNG